MIGSGRIGIAFVAPVLLLAAAGRVAMADTMTISADTEKDYKKYLQEVPATAQAAFAVSTDGSSDVWDYCDDGECKLSQLAAWVKAQCESAASGKCLIMDTNRDLRVDYTVGGATAESAAPTEDTAAATPAPTPSSEQSKTPSSSEAPVYPSGGIKQHILSAEQLKALIIGSSLKGVLTDGDKWTEYHDPSGEVRGFDDQQGTWSGKYKIRGGNMMCFDFEGTENDWCTRISLEGDKVTFIKPSGEVDTFSHDNKLLKGNPEDL
jgi:hypothetical protein